MPVIKIFSNQRPGAAACDALAGALRSLCIDSMGAQPDAIQVILVEGAHVLDGASVFVEAHYRDRPDRRGEALVRFLEGLDVGEPTPAVQLVVRGWFAFVEEISLNWLDRREPPRDELVRLLMQVLGGALEAAGQPAAG